MKKNNDDLTVVGAIIMAIIFCLMNIFYCSFNLWDLNMGDKKPGWTYGHSEALNQDFAFRKDNNNGLELYTEDKTHYTWQEIRNIQKHNAPIPLQVHLIKKVFNGVLLK